MEIRGNLRAKSLGDLDEILSHDAAGRELDRGAERRTRLGGGEPNPREMPRRRCVLEQPQALGGQLDEIEIAVAVDVDRGG